MGLVEHGQIPPGGTKLVLQFFVARHLVQANDEIIQVLEGISARRGGFEFFGEHAKFQPELLEHFVAPLLNQTAWSDDHHPARVGPHDEFTDVKTRHDGLSGSGIVRQHEAQRLTRQHGFVNGGDLVRQRVHVGRVDGHHRVEKKSQVDALGFHGQLERLAVPVEGPGPLGSCHADSGFVAAVQKPVLERSGLSLIDQCDGPLGNGNDRHNRHNLGRFDAFQGQAWGDGFEGNHCKGLELRRKLLNRFRQSERYLMVAKASAAKTIIATTVKKAHPKLRGSLPLGCRLA